MAEVRASFMFPVEDTFLSGILLLLLLTAAEDRWVAAVSMIGAVLLPAAVEPGRDGGDGSLFGCIWSS
jgi:hypothetical protein